ncbi:MAG: protein-glutamate O-methyltransferase CheR [bacterium]
MEKSSHEDIEIHLLLEAVFQRYGYDFRHYARASIKRRVRQLLVKSGCTSILEMIPGVLYDESFFPLLIQAFSITVTEMFRDPAVYLAIRKEVVPFLKTYPFIKVWHAGCATGEEVYSLAILLHEEGLYPRATIYATDLNDAALKIAKEGIYPVEQIRQSTSNYQQAGGTGSFAEYYYAQYNSVIMDKSLKKNIVFAGHNLATDSVFGEMHLIFCRNVLIYFDRELQNRVLTLLRDSLIHGGFLCLGIKEDLRFSGVAGNFSAVGSNERIYRKNPDSTVTPPGDLPGGRTMENNHDGKAKDSHCR